MQMIPHRAGEVTEWFDEYENDVNYMPWPSQPLGARCTNFAHAQTPSVHF